MKTAAFRCELGLDRRSWNWDTIAASFGLRLHVDGSKVDKSPRRMVSASLLVFACSLLPPEKKVVIEITEARESWRRDRVILFLAAVSDSVISSCPEVGNSRADHIKG